MAPATDDATAIKWFGQDPYFRSDWAAAKKAGLVRGAYHFGRPDLGNTPEHEADWFWSRVGPVLQPGDLLALDLECGVGALAPWAARFLARLTAHAGFYPVLYASPVFLATHGITYKNIGAKYGQWLADWTPHNPGPQNGWPVLALWQFGATTLAGIGKVDGDIFQGDRATLLKYGKPGAIAPATKPTSPPANAPVLSDTTTLPASSPVGQDELPNPPATNGGSPVVNDPTTVPVIVPDVPEPSAVAENGISTSEWKLAIAFLAQLAFTGTASVFTHLNMHVDAGTLNVIVQLEFIGGLAVVGYAISRGVRKFGTSK